MENILKQKNSNYFVWIPLGSRVNIYINYPDLNNTFGESEGGEDEEGGRGHVLLIVFSYRLSNRCHFRASNFLIKSTIKV